MIAPSTFSLRGFATSPLQSAGQIAILRPASRPGSVLRLRYPPDAEVREDEQLMAESMIPEGVHNHETDWTVFLLNRSVPVLSPARTRPSRFTLPHLSRLCLAF